MSVHVRGNSWFVRYRDTNKIQQQKHFGVGPKAKAKAEAYDLEIRLLKKRGHNPQGVQDKEMNIQDLYNAYIKDYEQLGRSQTQIRNLNYFFNNKVFPDFPKKTIQKLTHDDMLNFAIKYKDLSQSTRNRYFMYLKALFNFGIRHELIKNNPLKHWKKPKEEPKKFQINDDDLGIILKHSMPHLKLALQLCFYFGLRPGASELFNIKWKDIDFDENVLNIFSSKTKTSRKIPIPDNFRTKLSIAKKSSHTEYVIEYKGKPVKSLRRSFASAVKKAGITYPVRLYDLRHLYATTLLNSGADLAAVSSMMGHSAVTVTANVYYQSMSKERVRAANLLPQLHEGGKKIARESSNAPLPTGTNHPKKKSKKFKVANVGRIDKE
ncbi:tyrosine-type recombinase/integrase [Desulfovibrio sulfodismutans]|uniref:Tyrosine-type recombinase/integrase n=1 Tax=Desulfolutivibrio sulfodismutans TaxID=63561 RepID=A0A7K3NHE1_9BACT|nr:site-specific integrase [Desulfolutivibrio sulfodismutans]NDY55608.1 tyrosine-type recombinase/integrase [Desulfolutivibrio sulfodismutans]QLA11690.1 tyrosine-type recombinase/integrase [Desulfolutivibrio sulfodismutans DSM 3696]